MWGDSRPASIDPNKLNKLRIAQTLDRHCSLFVNGNQCLVLYALAQWTTGNSNNNNNSVWWWRHDLKIGRHGYAISSCPLWCCITLHIIHIIPSPPRWLRDGFEWTLKWQANECHSLLSIANAILTASLCNAYEEHALFRLRESNRSVECQNIKSI